MNLFEVIDTENNCSTSFADDLIAQTARFDVATSASMKPYAQEAENLRLLFIAGIASVDDVVAWADRTISTLPEYDDALTQISLGAKVPMAEMESRLNRVSEGSDFFEAIRHLLGRMHRTLMSDRSRARDFARVVDHLWIHIFDSHPDDLIFMQGIEDAFSLAETGIWGTIEEAIDRLISSTARFDHGGEG
jgi:hypothetical protein